MTPPRTIDDAELEGWTHLAIRCSKCHGLILFPFKMLRRHGDPVLLDIVPRLRCEKDGAKPITVELYRVGPPKHARGWPTDVHAPLWSAE